jgi:hypothetical protein
MVVTNKRNYYGKKHELKHDLNEMAHNLATSYLKANSYTYLPSLVPSCSATQHLEFPLMSCWQRLITDAEHSPGLEKTIMRTTKWTRREFNMVDRSALCQCINGMFRLQHLSYCKLLHGIINTDQQNTLGSLAYAAIVRLAQKRIPMSLSILLQL